MEFDVGCELSSRGRRNLRFAIGSLVAVMACAPSAHADEPPPPHDLDRVAAPTPPKWHDFYLGGGGGGVWGGFDTGGQRDTSGSYYSPNPALQAPGTRQDGGDGCKYVRRGNPITLANANKVEREVDFVTSDLEMPLYLERVYNSNRSFYWSSSSLGLAGWFTNFDFNLQASPDGFIDTLVGRPDGTVISFIMGADGVYREKKAGSIARITWSPAEGVFTHYTDSHTVERYKRQWVGNGQWGYWSNEIISVRNERGVGWDFARDQQRRFSEITHTSGRKITFRHDASGVTVLDPGGRTYRYNLQQGEGNSATTEVIYPGGEVRTYYFDSYQAAGDPNVTYYLTGKAFNGVRYSTFGWKTDPTMGGPPVPISTEHAGGVDKWQFDFIFDTQYGSVTSVSETNPLGKKATYEFDRGKLLRVTGHPSPNCSGTSVASKSYDSNGHEDLVTDTVGRVTDYDYDLHGHLLQKVEGAGTAESRTTQLEWDEAQNRLVRESIVGDHETRYSYLSNGLIASRTDVNLSPNGSIGATRVTTYGYTQHPNGILASVTVDGPLQGSVDSVTQWYNAQGNLTSVVNGAGHTITYSNHDPLGQPGRVTGANGAITDYGYDVRGRVVLERAYPSGQPVDTQYIYNPNGLLDGIQYADGTLDVFSYDNARRLVSQSRNKPDGGHEVRNTFYNAMSQPTRVEIGRDN